MMVGDVVRETYSAVMRINATMGEISKATQAVKTATKM